MKELVFVHGRSQQRKDAAALKAEWLGALNKGLAKSGLALPIPETQVRFPFYGDTLMDLIDGKSPAEAAKVIIKGTIAAADEATRQFVQDVLEEIKAARNISDAEVADEAKKVVAEEGGDPRVAEKGPLNWGWVQGILRAIDNHVPGGSHKAVATFTSDVHHYLSNDAISGPLNDGVLQAIKPEVETVVVGHSLGSVVSYNLLKNKGEELGWKVPLYVTVGSPLAIKRIRTAMSPIKHPPCVGKWFNAMDPNDVVALFPLDKGHFNINPGIENKTDVNNWTDNQHGIIGYLDDAEVAKRIHDALK